VTARATYEEGKTKRAREAAAEEARSRTVGMARLAVAALFFVAIGLVVWGPAPGAAWAGAGACAAAFAALVIVHARTERKKDRANAALRFHERGLVHLDGKWTDLPSKGERFRTADHPYADDLDVFGRASIFQRIDATETRFGEERLAALLSRDGVGEGWPNDVRERQAAVKDLAPRVAFREQLSALGALLSTEKPDPRPFLEWAEGSLPFPHGAGLVALARLLPAALIALAVFGSSFGLGTLPVLGIFLAEVLVGLALRGKVARIAAIVSAREAGVASYADMLALLESEKFDSPLLQSLQARLRSSGHGGATVEMRSLGRILGFLEARNNEVWRFFIGPALMWDLNCVVFLERWRDRTGKRVRDWFVVLGEIEALASLAGYAFERPDHAMPELHDAPTFEAKGLGHPLLREDKRVDNDVALPGPGHGLIVTGSNMSGKSTLLRAMGANAVLALAGAPVCARSLRIGPVRVVTSMRVRDSLEEGVSHFYAELQKLKRVIDLSRQPRTDGAGAPSDKPGAGTVFFLLDEILHGTNSRERILGARAIIKELLSRGAMGAVSTHDLGISDLDREIAGDVLRNVHFEEQVEGDRMTFDYTLRNGIVQSSNALRLMKLVGIDVVSPDA